MHVEGVSTDQAQRLVACEHHEMMSGKAENVELQDDRFRLGSHHQALSTLFCLPRSRRLMYVIGQHASKLLTVYVLGQDAS
jgi:hypothetical protein